MPGHIGANYHLALALEALGDNSHAHRLLAEMGPAARSHPMIERLWRRLAAARAADELAQATDDRPLESGAESALELPLDPGTDSAAEGEAD